MRVGYAGVSSVGQSLDVRLERLAHCERIFQEKRSGTTDQRPALKESLGFVREGDTLVVTKLDRLARSMLHLCAIGEELASRRSSSKCWPKPSSTLCNRPSALSPPRGLCRVRNHPQA